MFVHPDAAQVAASFSALQRAENSSIALRREQRLARELFQCSSASRKFLNCGAASRGAARGTGFSALQRAENSSIWNSVRFGRRRTVGFSALQRAENSSITSLTSQHARPAGVSVLFSEPKIPQSRRPLVAARVGQSFQCSSASRKFLNNAGRGGVGAAAEFQCSSASRKFLNTRLRRKPSGSSGWFQCSSASRKFLNRLVLFRNRRAQRRFSALQRAENSSIERCEKLRSTAQPRVSVLFSEPKIPQ